MKNYLRTYFIGVILLFVQHVALCQTIFFNDSIINKCIKDLENSNIDTILIYEEGCIDCMSILVYERNDSCFYIGEPQISYVFWQKNGLTNLQKLSNCECLKFEPITCDISKVWDYYYSNIELLTKEQILSPMYIRERDTLKFLIDDANFTMLKIIDNENQIEIGYHDYYFDEIIEGKYVNLNYDINSKSLKKEFKEIVFEQIELLEKIK